MGSSQRVAAAYLQRQALRIDNRKGEYPTKFWRDVILRMCKVLGVKHSNMKVVWRKRIPGEAAAYYHVATGNIHIKILEPYLNNKKFIERLFQSLAHELTHARQYQKGLLSFPTRNEDGVKGSYWDGVFYPEDYPYRKLPWEIEAFKVGDQVGSRIYRQVLKEGLLPLSRSERERSRRPFEGPTLGDWGVLSKDEQVADVAFSKEDFDAWLEVWRERYKTQWRGLDPTNPLVGNVNK